jgi:hypothetical protein
MEGFIDAHRNRNDSHTLDGTDSVLGYDSAVGRRVRENDAQGY